MLKRLLTRYAFSFGVLLPLICFAACEASHTLGSASLPASTCGTFAPGPNLQVCAATYLTGATIQGGGVAVGRDGAVIVATHATVNAGLSADVRRELIAGGEGVIYRLNSSGTKAVSETRLGAALFDLELAASTGTIYVAGAPFGVAALSSDANRLLWRFDFAADRLGVGADGSVAAVQTSSGRVVVLNDQGQRLAEFSARSGGTVSDVAIHTPSGTVIVVGALPAGASQTPLFDGHNFDGSVRWQNYGWSSTLLAQHQLGASTRGLRVTTGADGRLYYLGESHGGNTVHGFLPRDLSQRAPIVGGSAFHTPFNTNRFVSFVGKFDPVTGMLETSQYLLARDPDGTANAKGVDTFAQAIAADERGYVLVGGQQACCGPQPNDMQVAGQAIIPAVEGLDAFAVLLPPSLASSTVWTTWAQGGSASLLGVALGPERAVWGASQSAIAAATGPMVTQRALQSTPPAGPSASFVAVWPRP